VRASRWLRVGAGAPDEVVARRIDLIVLVEWLQVRHVIPRQRRLVPVRRHRRQAEHLRSCNGGFVLLLLTKQASPWKKSPDRMAKFCIRPRPRIFQHAASANTATCGSAAFTIVQPRACGTHLGAGSASVGRHTCRMLFSLRSADWTCTSSTAVAICWPVAGAARHASARSNLDTHA